MVHRADTDRANTVNVNALTLEHALNTRRFETRGMSAQVLALLAMWLLGAAQAHALDCWVATIDTTQAGYAKAQLTGMREAVMTAEQIVRDNPHFKAMPRQIRIRNQISVGPAFAQFNAHAYRPDVWEGKCGLVKGADRCCRDGGINMMVNSPEAILFETHSRDDELHIFMQPRRTGTVAGFPEYESKVLLSVNGRVPWLPVTVAEYFDSLERQQLASMEEKERNRPKMYGVDPLTVQKSYENMKKINPKAAEEFLANMQAQMEQVATQDKARHERSQQLDAARLAEIRRTRAGLTPAQLASQAHHGNGPLLLGRADDPLSRPLVKRDPNFPDMSDPNRVQTISVFVSVVENDQVLERKATMMRTKETLDYARLEKLLR